MNLDLEAYDWWATKIPTQYRTLDSYSKSFNGFVHINDENGENLFDAYLKVWVSHFYQSSDRTVRRWDEKRSGFIFSSRGPSPISAISIPRRTTR